MGRELLISTDFSGIGSPEAAVEDLRVPHRIVFACEKDKYARASFLANHNPEIFYEDVTTRDNEATPYSDLYVFGFPCQAFSIAGKQLGFEDMRGTLVFNSADYIRKKRPRVFVGENVKGLLSHDGGRTFRTVIDTFAISENGRHNMFHKIDCLGYHVFYKVLNTKDFGIPQNRERIFIVGFRDEEDALRFRFPKAMPLELRLKDLLQDNPNYYKISREVRSEEGKQIRRENLKNGIDYNPQRAKEIVFEEKEHVNTITTGLTKDNYLMVSGSGSFFEVPEKYYLSNTALQYLVRADQRERLRVNVTDGNDISTALTSNLHKGVHNGGETLIQINENTQKGFTNAEFGDSVNYSVPNSKTRRGRVGKGIAQTLDTACNQGVVIPELIQVGQLDGKHESSGRIYHEDGLAATLKTNTGGGMGNKTGIYQTGVRIRRLTPRECFRLQGFTDTQFDKCAAVNSDTQLYKQAGNSITMHTIRALIKNVLEAIQYA